MFPQSTNLTLFLLTISQLSLSLLALPVRDGETVGCTDQDCQPSPVPPSYNNNVNTITSILYDIQQSEILKDFLEEEMESVDILYTDEDRAAMEQAYEQHAHATRNRRWKRKVQNFQTSPSKKWPIPVKYQFQTKQEGLPIKEYTQVQKEIIRGAFHHWEQQTCVTFQEADSRAVVTSQHLIITNQGPFCASYVGKITLNSNQGQQINLADNCMLKFGTPVHEIGHALGLWHEHQRPDRGQYIHIRDTNIGAWARSNFQAPPSHYVNNYNIPYDYNSVMHYGAKVGTANGLNTIDTRDSRYQQNIGQRVQLSFLDAKAINLAYCADKCSSRLPRPCIHGGYQDPLRCDSCRCPDGLGGRYCELRAFTESNCGGDYNLSLGESRSFTTPGYTQGLPYQHRDQCNWLIKAPQGHRVKLEFKDDFHLFCRRGVCYHWVEVQFHRDLGIPGPRFCCSQRPDHMILSQGEQMMVTFRSNWTGTADTERKGFKVQVSVVTADGKPLPESTTTSPTTTTTTTTTATRRAVTTTLPTITTSSSSPTMIMWSSWSRCTGNQCSCGGCSKQSRVRMCNSKRCTGRMAAEEYRMCTRLCTAADKRTIYPGQPYQVQCPICCPGFEPRGSYCARSRNSVV